MDCLKSPNISKTQQFTLLLLICIVLLSTFQQNVHAKCLDTEKKKLFNQFSLTQYCRKHILSPACRGHQKRDLLSRLNAEYKFPQLEPDELGTIIKSPSLLGTVLRKAIEASGESNSDDYIK